MNATCVKIGRVALEGWNRIVDLEGAHDMPTTDDFRHELTRQFSSAEARGLTEFEIKAGDLHRFVGDYPGRNHRMPSCCDAMYNAMMGRDRVISKPLMGKGASLTIRYQLPR